VTPYLQNNHTKRAGGMAQVIEGLAGVKPVKPCTEKKKSIIADLQINMESKISLTFSILF
jgi:hypothetical protein